MRDFSVDVKVFDGPELIASKDLYILSYMRMDDEGKGELWIQKCFLDNLGDLCSSEAEKERVLDEFVAQQKEEFDMQNNEENPFHGHAEEFQNYCRKRYKILFGYVERLLDRMLLKK